MNQELRLNRAAALVGAMVPVLAHAEGLCHTYVHEAADPAMAIQMARDVYTRRQEGTSIWVVRSEQIVASDPVEKGSLFEPADDKVYRHPTFYELPEELNHM